MNKHEVLKRFFGYENFRDGQETLTDMCAKLPVTEQEFLGVSGVGTAKLEQFGDKLSCNSFSVSAGSFKDR